MNIAFPAILISLFILPGILLSFSYRRGSFVRSPVSLGPVQAELLNGLFWSLVLHVLGALFLNHFRAIDLSATLVLLAGWPNVGDKTLADNVSTLVSDALTISYYLIAINILALIAGKLAGHLVRRYYLDLRFDWLRFNNSWYYLFSGEVRVLDVPQAERSISSIKELLSTDIAYVFVSAVVQTGDSTLLYWGTLTDYYFDRNGVLDRIVLTRAQRRDLSQDRSGRDESSPDEDPRFYPIAGDFLVLKYSAMSNLSVEYTILASDETTAQSSS